MNKYVDHLTLPEYRIILQAIKKDLELEKNKLDENGQNKTYVELRFIELKVKQIIKKYEKAIDNK